MYLLITSVHESVLNSKLRRTCCQMVGGKAGPAMTASSSQAEWCCPCGQPTSRSRCPTTGPSVETSAMRGADKRKRRRKQTRQKKEKENRNAALGWFLLCKGLKVIKFVPQLAGWLRLQQLVLPLAPKRNLKVEKLKGTNSDEMWLSEGTNQWPIWAYSHQKSP